MNNQLQIWLEERIDDLASNDLNYDDHVDQFIKKNEWVDIYDDCIKLLVDAIEYVSLKGIKDVVVFLNIPLIQSNRIIANDYDSLKLDIPNFVSDSRFPPPSLYIYKRDDLDFREGDREVYIRPIQVDKRLDEYDCTALYKCEREALDIEGDYPFYRNIQIKCYL
ncbi:hypothetical protein [Pseudodesulfovibrio sp. zrk46]|uniref:hypothetical protein n=1 Tax=Pseudodesulfovibrio sp. zrk46 TaxID=2725288 RepID=UPI001449E7C9|nr:hypothetical protein [Pseudodesulfovibrio sp. zrk46]QJB56878.1 hypothetical protein HFN16_10895 [Pseudodesulfovibrio sp. zrk46]